MKKRIQWRYCVAGRWMACCCLVFFVAAGHAQNITRSNISGPAGLLVNSYTGNLFYKRTDLVIPHYALPLTIQFAYNSASRSVDHGFGYGWTFEYNRYYRVDSTGNITVSAGDGRRDKFTVSNNNYSAAQGIFDILIQFEAGKFKLTTPEKMEYYFEDSTHKKLTRIRELNGNEITLHYTGNYLSRIVDAAGRQVFFTWQNTRLVEIRAEAATPARTWVYNYNPAGCLTAVTNPLGHVTRYAYGSGRAMNGITDGNGNNTAIGYNSKKAVTRMVSCQREMTISYNKDQRKTYLVEKNGEQTIVTSFEYDRNGRLIGQSGNCCGFKHLYEYDEHNNINRRIDGNGNVTLFTYDKRGNPLSVTDPLGKMKLFTYDTAYYRINSITDKNGNVTQFAYNEKGDVTETKYPLGVTIRYTYDDRGRRLTYTDAKNNTTTYTYDQYGYMETRRDAMGNTVRTLFDAWGNLVTHTNARNFATRYTYDVLNRLTSITDALNGITRFEYDANGNRTTITDERNNTTRNIYDAENNLIAVVDPLDNTTQMSYDALGNISSKTDANGNTTTYRYDQMNRLVEEINGEGERRTYNYDANGNIISVKWPNGNTFNIQYDALNRITAVSDRLGAVGTYTYDNKSNRLSETDGNGSRVTYQYDALDRMVAKMDAMGNTISFEYDANNNLVKETDRSGNSVTNTYDALNRKTQARDALNNLTVWQYDAMGNITSITDARNNITASAYDALNRKTLETFADNTTKAFTWDEAGNLITLRDNNGVTTRFSFDKLNRTARRQYPSGADSLTYDAGGRLTEATNNQAVVKIHYDKADRITGETLNGKNTIYSYDIPGNKKRIIYPGGRTIEREMNVRNQLVSIRNGNGDRIADFVYNNSRRLTGRRYANNTSGDLSYNSSRQLTEVSYNPQRFVDIGYEYDKEDNPTAAAFRHRPAASEAYVYDNLHRLSDFRKAGDQSTYNYDATGNRTTAQLNGIVTTYTVNNQNAYSTIAQANTVTLTYDANGNNTNDGNHNYTYDHDNRITAVDNGNTASYAYDAFGRRISKTTAAGETRYFFDGLHVIEERNAADSLVSTYVWGGWVDDMVSMTRGGQTYFYHTNIVGSVVAVTDSAGRVAERYEYDPFGKVSFYSANYTALPASAIGNNYTYTGREYESETGLYYYRARHYNVFTGQFLQKDPMEPGDGAGLYTYVLNNPVAYRDPLGLYPSWLPLPWELGLPMLPGDIQDRASEDAEEKFGNSAGGGHNDVQDAYRHCLGLCMATMDYGDVGSWAIGEGNELLGWLTGQPDEEACMDRNNNGYGNSMGNKPGQTIAGCEDDCYNAASNGLLDTIIKEKR